MAYDLLRESIDLSASNPRAALIAAMTAVEVRVKALITGRVPHAGWLVQEVPSPPVVAMLRDYVPKLPAQLQIDGRVVAPPARVLERLKDGVSKRNQITHRGAETVDRQFLREVTEAVSDCLRLLDYYSGQSWALPVAEPRDEARDRRLRTAPRVANATGSHPSAPMPGTVPQPPLDHRASRITTLLRSPQPWPERSGAGSRRPMPASRVPACVTAAHCTASHRGEAIWTAQRVETAAIEAAAIVRQATAERRSAAQAVQSGVVSDHDRERSLTMLGRRAAERSGPLW